MLNVEDLKVRKQWLVVFLLMTVMTIVHQIIVYQFDLKLSDEIPMRKNIFLLISCAGMLAVNYLFYHCAYKKFGTKFLMFFLILSPLSLVSSAIIYLWGIVPYVNYFPGYWVLTVMSFALGIGLFVLNWKMRKINLRIKYAKV
ncbi:MAG: hypothetical protein K1X28_06035 [Parachlamydiales bacterium]|nr:hypothetical protein [Parachlamydiales bacterium]